MVKVQIYTCSIFKMFVLRGNTKHLQQARRHGKVCSLMVFAGCVFFVATKIACGKLGGIYKALCYLYMLQQNEKCQRQAQRHRQCVGLLFIHTLKFTNTILSGTKSCSKLGGLKVGLQKHKSLNCCNFVWLPLIAANRCSSPFTAAHFRWTHCNIHHKVPVLLVSSKLQLLIN